MSKLEQLLLKATLATLCLIAVSPIPASPEATGYGYLVQSGSPCAVWWAEGAYKVMKTDPVPAAKGPVVRLSAAGNEFEPFLLVLRPEKRLDSVRVSAGPLRSDQGADIQAAAISVSRVEYVKITTPTDERGAAGWWPDPLPLYDGPFMASAGENHPLWITVRVPMGTAPGLYNGEVRLAADGWSCAVPVELRVRNFALPDKSSVRSSFGIVTSDIMTYHNLDTREELEKVTELYYANLRDHRVAPTSPFDLYPMKIAVSGVYWKGGEFVTEGAHGGRRALKIADDDLAQNMSASYDAPITVSGRRPVRLSLWARAAAKDQPYTVLLEGFDAGGRWIAGANILNVFNGATDWKREVIELPSLPDEVQSLRLTLFATFRDNTGKATGTAWFDDIALEAAPRGPDARLDNLLAGGDFEMPVDGMKISVDFSDFDRGARLYLDEFGFNAYDLSLQGLGTGSFYSRE
ncbi:MAG: hypothetical protein ACXVJK_09945, partial [Candidatus Aminicenantales bacterium]